MHHYRACGLAIRSSVVLPLRKVAEFDTVDVVIEQQDEAWRGAETSGKFEGYPDRIIVRYGQ